jgi:hypothetical protein
LRGVVEDVAPGELGKGAADELLEREPVELARRRVRIDVPTLVIREHHRLERAVEHGPEELLVPAQLVLGRVE